MIQKICKNIALAALFSLMALVYAYGFLGFWWGL